MPSWIRRRALRLTFCCLAWCYLSAENALAGDGRDAAAALVPMQSLTPEAQQKLAPILKHPTLYRRMPAQSFDCDPEMFTFLVRRPEVLVGVWEMMGITKVQTKRLGPFTMEGLDAAGTSCKMELIYGTPKMHVYYGTGRYDGPMIPQGITGRGVFVVHSDYATSAIGRNTVACNMDIFLQLDNLGVDLIARTIQPLMWSTAEQNFTESAKYVTQVSQASELNPDGMKDLAGRLPQLNEDVREQFRTLIDRVATRADQRWATVPANRKPETVTPFKTTSN